LETTIDLELFLILEYFCWRYCNILNCHAFQWQHELSALCTWWI